MTPPRVVTGVDLVEVDRIARLASRFGDRFGARVFTPAEWGAYAAKPMSLAARFAAKEAVAKALGCGLFVNGVSPAEIEVLGDESGAPALRLYGATLDLASSSGVVSWSVSLSHTRELAIAMVVGLVSG